MTTIGKRRRFMGTSALLSVCLPFCNPAFADVNTQLETITPAEDTRAYYGDTPDPRDENYSYRLTHEAVVGGMTADGNAFVGTVYRNYSNAIYAGFEWTETGGVGPAGNAAATTPSEAYYYFTANDISADGSVIVGKAAGGISNHPGVQRAYRWTAAEGYQDLGTVDRTATFGQSDARAVSGDGRTVVGYDRALNGSETAFRWTQETGMVSLGFLPGRTSSGNDWARGASWDGSVIVGQATGAPEGSFGASALKPFRWTEATGMEQLSIPAGNNPYALDTGYASDVSWDGRVIVGAMQPGGIYGHRAVRWTDGTMALLGTLPEVEAAQAADISEALGVSGNGDVIVGLVNGFDSRTHGFRWTEDGGMQTVEDWLRDSGATIDASVPGRSEITLTAVSTNADGSVVVGITRDSETYIARGNGTGSAALPGSGDTGGGDTGGGGTGGGDTGGGDTGGGGTGGGVTGGGDTGSGDTGGGDTGGGNTGGGDTGGGGTGGGDTGGGDTGGGDTGGGNTGGGNTGSGVGIITVSSLGSSLATTGAANTTTTRSLGVIVNGAGSRPLDRRVEQGRSIFWTGGDWGTDQIDGKDGRFGLGEVGFGHNFGAFQLNGVVGTIANHQDAILGGKTETRATYVKLEALRQLSGTNDRGLWAAFTASGLWGTAELTRGYLVGGGALDTSRGKTDVEAYGIRARLQYENIVPMISPYGELSHSKSCLDAYSESGGAFPAAFDRLCDEATELRLGFDAEVPLSSRINLLGTLEGVHRFQDSGSSVAGEVIGIGAFDLGAPDYQQDWLRAGLGISADLGGSKLSIIANGTTKGEAADAWIAANWSIKF
ncbi:hypothetical protein BMI86_16290 [Thioclava sp. DLFJ5-1]|uniref:autotransporter domain-containing protein n=1 Tax=Thioclava sp. DLFJ5-1 TaxID=1915314 RepID=UPI0009D2BB6A|nr:autotransporter domain-containing protein [Thioclava sp. DLFJ5-1]OOY19374.1 hypothetical protein BMI86_16290 [Thioclava sp. DLFJ5-1]